MATSMDRNCKNCHELQVSVIPKLGFCYDHRLHHIYEVHYQQSTFVEAVLLLRIVDFASWL